MAFGSLMRTTVLVAASAVWAACDAPRSEVVVYTSEDQVFSEPILRDFEEESGISVRAVYDTEEAKGTGVMNRLLSEKDNPQADVYWANEPIRAVLLAQEGVAAPYVSPQAMGIPERFKDPEGYWTGFSARARVLMVRTDAGAAPEPTSILAYTDPAWAGRAVIANPLFGTTATEMAAIDALRGTEELTSLLTGMKANGVEVSTSNGESADLVCAGAFAFSLVDSDDAMARARRGCPVRVVYPDQYEGGMGTLILPNAVVLIRGGPNPQSARSLIDYLLSARTEEKLARSDAAQIPLHPGVEPPAGVRSMDAIVSMPIDYGEVARALRRVSPLLERWMER
jgi:iron(III) transport system substrate-binding protein